MGRPQTADQIDNRKELELANWRKAPDPMYLDRMYFDRAHYTHRLTGRHGAAEFLLK